MENDKERNVFVDFHLRLFLQRKQFHENSQKNGSSSPSSVLIFQQKNSICKATIKGQTKLSNFRSHEALLEVKPLKKSKLNAETGLVPLCLFASLCAKTKTFFILSFHLQKHPLIRFQKATNFFHFPRKEKLHRNQFLASFISSFPCVFIPPLKKRIQFM
jgi:hypothetical protein